MFRKLFGGLTLAAALMVGSWTMAPAPASAHFDVSIGVGLPAPMVEAPVVAAPYPGPPDDAYDPYDYYNPYGYGPPAYYGYAGYPYYYGPGVSLGFGGWGGGYGGYYGGGYYGGGYRGPYGYGGGYGGGNRFNGNGGGNFRGGYGPYGTGSVPTNQTFNPSPWANSIPHTTTTAPRLTPHVGTSSVGGFGTAFQNGGGGNVYHPNSAFGTTNFSGGGSHPGFAPTTTNPHLTNQTFNPTPWSSYAHSSSMRNSSRGMSSGMSHGRSSFGGMSHGRSSFGGMRGGGHSGGFLRGLFHGFHR